MTGKRPKELDDLLEFPTDMMYQWKYFIDLHNKRTSSGFSANPITYTDMCSYFSLIGYRPEEWEIDLINSLDQVFLEVQQKQQEEQQKKKKP